MIFALSVKFLYHLKFAKSALASITLGCLRAENRTRQGSRVGCCRWGNQTYQVFQGSTQIRRVESSKLLTCRVAFVDEVDTSVIDETT